MKIDSTEVIFLDGDLSNCTQIQGEAYKFLMCLTQAGVESYSAKTLSQQLGLRSTLPLWSRLRHLEEHGKIQLFEEAIAV
jgi:hypothetical protein